MRNCSQSALTTKQLNKAINLLSTMSAFKTVFDFLENVPQGMKHEEQYLQYVQTKLRSVDKVPVNLIAWELASLSHTEKNILVGLNMNDKFRLRNMHHRLPMQISSLMKHTVQSDGAGSIKNKESKQYTYETNNELYLDPITSRLVSNEASGIVFKRDMIMRQRIMAACPNLEAQTVSGVTATLVGEKIASSTNMKHMLTKGYLMLMDYNLAGVSKLTERQVTGVRFPIASNITPIQRMAAIATYDVVIDTSCFTESQLKLIGYMGCSYPSVKYAGNNVYNSINMEADSLIFIGKGSVAIDSNPSFGSADEMYFDLVEIACKLGVLEDLRYVVSHTRGLPFLLNNICDLTNQSEFVYGCTLSTCHRSSLGEVDYWRDYVVQSSNYLATTKNLIADLLVGEALKLCVLNCVCDIGALGSVTCPSGRSRDDPVLNSTLRDHGYKHDNEKLNVLKQAFRGVKGCGVDVNFAGSLKLYALEASARARDNKLNVTPQVNFEIVYQPGKSNPWSAMRGASVTSGTGIVAEQAVELSMQKQALLWCIGVTKTTPRVGLNMVGSTTHDLFTFDEIDKLAHAKGSYKINNINYMIGCDVEGRVDSFEVSAISVHRTMYVGTRCETVMTGDGEMSINAPSLMVNIDAAGSLSHKRSEQIPDDNSDDGDDTQHKFASWGGGDTPDRDKEQQEESRDDSLNLESPIDPKEAFSIPNKIGGSKLLPKLTIANKRKLSINATTPFKFLDGKPVPKTKDEDKITSVGKHRIKRVVTPGDDAKCGLYAILQDLVINGYVDPADYKAYFDMYDKYLGKQTWHETTQLAYLANHLGFGLRVFTPRVDNEDVMSQEGYQPSLLVHQFGEGSHTINIYNDGGTHYETVVPGQGELVTIAEMSSRTPAESLHEMETMKEWFTFERGSKIANKISSFFKS